MENQDRKQNEELIIFRARRTSMMEIVFSIIFFIFLLILAVSLPGINVSLPFGICIIMFVTAIWRYNMEYVKFGSDFIAIRKPAPVGGTKTVLFNEINKIEFQKKKIFIFYINATTGEQQNAVIALNFMEDGEQHRLVSLLESFSKKLDIKTE